MNRRPTQLTAASTPTPMTAPPATHDDVALHHPLDNVVGRVNRRASPRLANKSAETTAVNENGAVTRDGSRSDERRQTHAANKHSPASYHTSLGSEVDSDSDSDPDSGLLVPSVRSQRRRGATLTGSALPLPVKLAKAPRNGKRRLRTSNISVTAAATPAAQYEAVSSDGAARTMMAAATGKATVPLATRTAVTATLTTGTTGVGTTVNATREDVRSQRTPPLSPTTGGNAPTPTTTTTPTAIKAAATTPVAIADQEKRRARECIIDGCTSYVINRGLCFRHGVRYAFSCLSLTSPPPSHAHALPVGCECIRLDWRV